MEGLSLPKINLEKCTGCGLCIPVCPHDTLVLEEGKAVVSGEHCMTCGHCRAACPAGAVLLPELKDSMQAFSSFAVQKKWLASGPFPVADLAQLMLSRRSCRNYQNKPVPLEMLQDLVKMGIAAPSGTNSQKWTFTILSTRHDVLALGDQIAAFFKRTNRMAENHWLRKALKLVGKGELDAYYTQYYDSVEYALDAYENRGRDLLFHGAPALIVVGCESGASCPAEDALLATGNILLGAQAMGLGSCLIGYAVRAMQKNPDLQKSLKIPPDETVYAVIAAGFPNETYSGFPGRKKCRVRHFQP